MANQTLRLYPFSPREAVAAAIPMSLAALLSGCAATSTSTPTASSDTREEIYVLRSIREQHTPSPDWCSPDRTGFAPLPSDAEHLFSFWTLQVQSSDGKVTQFKQRQVADARACFGPTGDPAVRNFYAEGKLAALPFRGKGECRVMRVDYPEKSLFPVRCVLNLSEMPAPYVGGMLTANTMASKAPMGGETDPPGYTQSSIATIRLWKSN
jgi:hypothetical protein